MDRCPWGSGLLHWAAQICPLPSPSFRPPPVPEGDPEPLHTTGHGVARRAGGHVQQAGATSSAGVPSAKPLGPSITRSAAP